MRNVSFVCMYRLLVSYVIYYPSPHKHHRSTKCRPCRFTRTAAAGKRRHNVTVKPPVYSAVLSEGKQIASPPATLSVLFLPPRNTAPTRCRQISSRSRGLFLADVVGRRPPAPSTPIANCCFCSICSIVGCCRGPWPRFARPVVARSSVSLYRLQSLISSDGPFPVQTASSPATLDTTKALSSHQLPR